jgi:uncharacterized damage-inducible protein DinB
MVIERSAEESEPTHFVKRLAQYSCWANAEWITFIERHAPSDEFLVKRMSHILLGEDAWFRRIRSEPLDPDVWAVLTFNQMRDRLARHRDTFETLLGTNLTSMVGTRASRASDTARRSQILSFT